MAEGKTAPANREVRTTKAFRHDLSKAGGHRKCDPGELKKVMQDLESRRALDVKCLDHPLKGRYPRRSGETDCRECHTSNDWLLIYRLPDDNSVIFIRTGTHSELFES